MFIIMKANMYIEIRDNNIYQFFGDETYRCVPLITYALIINETKVTYLILFNNLKEKFGYVWFKFLFFYLFLKIN